MGATAIFAALAGAAGATILSKGGGSPPQPAAPKPMPLPDDKANAEARRRALVEQYGRRGRASTILTAQDETLGG